MGENVGGMPLGWQYGTPEVMKSAFVLVFLWIRAIQIIFWQFSGPLVTFSLFFQTFVLDNLK